MSALFRLLLYASQWYIELLFQILVVIPNIFGPDSLSKIPYVFVNLVHLVTDEHLNVRNMIWLQIGKLLDWLGDEVSEIVKSSWKIFMV